MKKFKKRLCRLLAEHEVLYFVSCILGGLALNLLLQVLDSLFGIF